MNANRWRQVKLSDLGRVVTGKTPPSARPELFGLQHPFITPSDIDGVSRSVATTRFVSDAGAAAFPNQMIPAGSVCFVCIGATIGKMCIAACRSLTNQQVNSIVVDQQRHDASFVFYALRCIAADVKVLAGGAATPIISKSSFSDIVVTVPPPAEQRRIASILSAYDDLIENNTRRIAILEEMARRIYEEWFVHFRFPGHEQVRMVESELGPVPEGWRVRPFDEFATFTNGYAFKPDDWGEEGLPIIKIKELKAGVQADTPRYRASLPNKYKIVNGDLLFSWSADLDVYVWTDGDAWLNQHLFLVHSNDATVPKFFLFHALRNAMPQFRTRSNGATMKHIKRSALSEVSALVPPAEVTESFERVVGPQHKLRMNLARQNTNLRTTRDLLLPKLISGELDVSALPEPEAVAA